MKKLITVAVALIAGSLIAASPSTNSIWALQDSTGTNDLVQISNAGAMTIDGAFTASTVAGTLAATSLSGNIALARVTNALGTATTGPLALTTNITATSGSIVSLDADKISGNIAVARITNAIGTASGGAINVATNFGLWGVTGGSPVYGAASTNYTGSLSIPITFGGTSYYIRCYNTANN